MRALRVGAVGRWGTQGCSGASRNQFPALLRGGEMKFFVPVLRGKFPNPPPFFFNRFLNRRK